MGSHPTKARSSQPNLPTKLLPVHWSDRDGDERIRWEKKNRQLQNATAKPTELPGASNLSQFNTYPVASNKSSTSKNNSVISKTQELRIVPMV